MTHRLGASVWPDLPEAPLVLVPVGSTEQHGPHLPFSTDTMIAVAVSERVADRIGPATVIAPAVAYGSSGEHQDFPGTCSIGTDVLRLVLIELVRSLRRWAGRVVFINGHGGNLAALRAAVPQLAAEGHEVAWAPCAVPGSDLHAGATESALMLHLHPTSVHAGAAMGNTTSLAQLLPLLRTSGVRALSANGVLGDPTSATAEQGATLFTAMERDVHNRIQLWQRNVHGMLSPAAAVREPTG